MFITAQPRIALLPVGSRGLWIAPPVGFGPQLVELSELMLGRWQATRVSVAPGTSDRIDRTFHLGWPERFLPHGR